uniref:Uncharacterized protein n=1 Tax=Oryza sativa subsp. japonica TaxID=39947 RepID=Q6ZAZ8_ORYSJ|nr:hypothetical protein [Oryza sativa Japonica Group]BAD09771.1 hypothetical protein [Oryza sativa Japonica Group]
MSMEDTDDVPQLLTDDDLDLVDRREKQTYQMLKNRSFAHTRAYDPELLRKTEWQQMNRRIQRTHHPVMLMRVAGNQLEMPPAGPKPYVIALEDLPSRVPAVPSGRCLMRCAGGTPTQQAQVACLQPPAGGARVPLAGTTVPRRTRDPGAGVAAKC